MSVLKLSIASGRPDTYLITNFETAGGNKAIIQRILNYLTGLTTGTEKSVSSSVAPSVAISVRGSEAQASGTLTLASVVATNTATINGVVFTAIASGATGNQFNVGGSDTVTAANLAAVINASVTALIPGYVTATSALGVVTVTSAFYGLGGNQSTLVGSTNITASAARLTGGTLDSAALTLNF